MFTQIPDVVVARDLGMINWIADQLDYFISRFGGLDPGWGIVETVDGKFLEYAPHDIPVDRVRKIPIKAEAHAEDVRGKVVCGNLPLYFAAMTRGVYAVDFILTPPRGTEYTAADMVSAGAVLHFYSVIGRVDPA